MKYLEWSNLETESRMMAAEGWGNEKLLFNGWRMMVMAIPQCGYI